MKINSIYFQVYSFLPFLTLSLTISWLCLTPAVASTDVPQKVSTSKPSIALQTIAQQITVQVQGKSNQGSGVIISRQVEGFYVLTNAHVVPKSIPYQVITADGVSHRVIRRLIIPQLDLALLLFTSERNYRVATINDAPITTGTEIYVAGWPRSGGSLRQPIFTSTKGKITATDSNLPLGYSLSYSNLVRAGMSGGPILDAQGRVLGINGIVRLDKQNNQRVVASGIPINTYLQWQNSQRQFSLTNPIERSPTVKLRSDRATPSLYGLQKQLAQSSGTVNALVFNSSQQTIISASSKGKIYVWQPETQEVESYERGDNSSINAIALSPDATLLATAGDDRLIQIWNLATKQVVKTLSGHTGEINSLVFSPNGQTLISGGWDKTIRLWQLSTGKTIATLTGHLQTINSLAISPDGQTLVSGSQDRTIRLWQLPTGKEIGTLQGHSLAVLSLAISADGQTLASGSGDGRVNLWQLNTQQLINSFQAHSDGIWSIAIAADNQTLFTSSWDKKIKIWQLSPTMLKATLTRHRDYISALIFGNDDKTLISGDWGGQIYIWRQ